MTRTLTVLVLVAALAACTLGGRSTPPPVAVDLAGAAGLYVQSPSGGRSITAPDGATLMKLLSSGTTGPAVFEDATGAEVTVTVTRTHQLSPEYLLAALDYGESSLTALVTLATGELRSPPVPMDNWERVRVVGSTAYYVSGGAIHRVDLDTLAAVDMSQGDRISGSSLVFVDAAGDVHTFNVTVGSVSPANEVRIYYVNGDPPDVLGWGTPQAVLFCEWYGQGSALEDQATGRVYHVHGGVGGLQAEEIIFDAAGVTIGSTQILDPALVSAHYRLTVPAGKSYLQDVAFYSDTYAATVQLDGLGAISGATVRAVECYNVPAVYRDGVVYTASATGIDTMDMASGVADQPVAEAGIEALEVVAGQIFYSKPDGVWKYDPVLDTTEKMAETPAEILAVTR